MLVAASMLSRMLRGLLKKKEKKVEKNDKKDEVCPLPPLLSLPPELQEKIVAYLDGDSLLCLRQASRKLKSIIDQNKFLQHFLVNIQSGDDLTLIINSRSPWSNFKIGRTQPGCEPFLKSSSLELNAFTQRYASLIKHCATTEFEILDDLVGLLSETVNLESLEIGRIHSSENMELDYLFGETLRPAVDSELYLEQVKKMEENLKGLKEFKVDWIRIGDPVEKYTFGYFLQHSRKLTSITLPKVIGGRATKVMLNSLWRYLGERFRQIPDGEVEIPLEINVEDYALTRHRPANFDILAMIGNMKDFFHELFLDSNRVVVNGLVVKIDFAPLVREEDSEDDDDLENPFTEEDEQLVLKVQRTCCWSCLMIYGCLDCKTIQISGDGTNNPTQ